YLPALILSVVVVTAYTFLGGFKAVCWTDLFQGLLMFLAIVVVPVAMYKGLSATDFVWSDLGGVSLGVTEGFGAMAIVSAIAWGLGYFGQPHILARFMAIKSSDMIKKSRIIATVWVFVTLIAAVLVGIFGNMWLNAHPDLLEKFTALGDAEKIFMFMSSSLLPALFAGIVLAAILAAIMSTADSQLLVTASAVTNDMFALFKKNAGPKTLMWVSRLTVVGISVIAYFIALDPNSSVMGLVSYAWAGLGAAFGPAMLLSLFWKRMTIWGAVAGAVVGGAAVIVWESVPVLAGTGIYSLLPAFFLALGAVVIGSLATKVDKAKVDELFAKAKSADVDAISVGK
ncbi:MAG: sodium/proline symporter, partial [Ruminococcaceae bacterium]|nr:sodium/proline symporter [Oscillospiraceae bacterium]